MSAALGASCKDSDDLGDSLTAQVVVRDGALTRSAAQALFEQLFPIIFRQMRSLSAGRGRELDELVQIAAEQALRSFVRFRGECRLTTWTYRICYRTLLKHDRARRRWRARFQLSAAPERVDARPDAAERLEADERMLRLRAALAVVSPKRRAVLVLHDLEDRSVDEIARIVDARPATVRSRLRDGRRQLAKLLAGDPYFGDLACGGSS